MDKTKGTAGGLGAVKRVRSDKTFENHWIRASFAATWI